MKAILICPGERPDVAHLATDSPLVLKPALGQSLLEYWMSYLTCKNVKHVVLLVQNGQVEFQNILGSGSRWGVTVEIVSESWEMTPAQATEKYGAPAFLADQFPGLPEHSPFAGYAQWFQSLMAWMPRARIPDRVGVREVALGIWVGLHCQISRQAQLQAPCWVGDHVYIGPGAVIGPEVVLENGAFVEPNAEITNSVVGPATFVGQYVQIKHSLALGGTLINWQTGLESKVSDAFLLCSLEPQRAGDKAMPLLDRVAEWLALWKEDQDQPLEPEPLLVKRGS